MPKPGKNWLGMKRKIGTDGRIIATACSECFIFLTGTRPGLVFMPGQSRIERFLHGYQ